MSPRNWRRILGTLEAKMEVALKAAPHSEDVALETALKALTLEELDEIKAIRAKLAAGLALDPQELERGYTIALKAETAAAAKWPGRSSFTPEQVTRMWLEVADPGPPLRLIYTRETSQPPEVP